MEILLTLTIGTLCIVCFYIGAKVGQMAAKGEVIKAPKVDLVAAHREREERKAAERAQERAEIIMRNVDRYDGTGLGQEDVPRG